MCAYESVQRQNTRVSAEAQRGRPDPSRGNSSARGHDLRIRAAAERGTRGWWNGDQSFLLCFILTNLNLSANSHVWPVATALDRDFKDKVDVPPGRGDFPQGDERGALSDPCVGAGVLRSGTRRSWAGGVTPSEVSRSVQLSPRPE